MEHNTIETALPIRRSGRRQARQRRCPPPANGDRKSTPAVTTRSAGAKVRDVPDMTAEKHRHGGEPADALFQEMKRPIAEKIRS